MRRARGPAFFVVAAAVFSPLIKGMAVNDGPRRVLEGNKGEKETAKMDRDVF